MNSVKKVRILVVEDDDDSRMALCTILEGLGYEPLAFTNAKEVLKNTADLKCDLAMIDIMMPEMNGFELLAELRQHPDFQNLPVIMVTARDADNEILEGYRLGADYYITKPYTAQQIQYGVKLSLE